MLVRVNPCKYWRGEMNVQRLSRIPLVEWSAIFIPKVGGSSFELRTIHSSEAQMVERRQFPVFGESESAQCLPNLVYCPMNCVVATKTNCRR